jgi:hypothetical protein
MGVVIKISAKQKHHGGPLERGGLIYIYIYIYI